MRARGKNVRRRPVPGGREGSRGLKSRAVRTERGRGDAEVAAVRTEEARDLVSRGAEQETKDEQEDLRIYEPEVGGVLFWRRLGRRFGRFGPVVTPRRLVETSLWGF